MNIDGIAHRTIRLAADGRTVEVIDQTRLPFELAHLTLRSLEDAALAIGRMVVRGAPLIGATAAYGVALAMTEDASDRGVDAAYARLMRTRPTAVNLRWALDGMRAALREQPAEARIEAAYARAAALCDEDVAINAAIGRHGLTLIEAIAARKPAGEPVNLLTHCNAGWLATVDWGTATAPIYMAHDKGIAVHVWVDETRPRNQGAALTAYELGHHGVPHTVIADNAGGHLMQHGLVDLVIVGTDRVSATGDVANKIGTYLKALAARDNGVPFYVALPSPTIDFGIEDGIREIPIEERGADEVLRMTGRTASGRIETVEVAAPGSPALNPAFDVTPARLVTGLITEAGIIEASRAGIAGLFPERAGSGTAADSAPTTRVLETAIYVDDLAAAETFYGSVLGLEVVMRAAGRHVFFRCDAAMLLVFDPAASSIPPAADALAVPPHGTQGPGHVCFAADAAALKGWRARLTQAGVAIEAEVDWPQGGCSIYVRDPAGNSVEFAEPRIWEPAD